MKTLECLNCYERYAQDESTAIDSKSLYCSESCEAESIASLAEGNKIVEESQVTLENRSQLLREAIGANAPQVRVPPNIKLNQTPSAPAQGDLNDLFKTKE